VVTSLLVDVVRREPLGAADGLSGSLLERVELAGGRQLVVKHILAASDWIMRASNDQGRAAELWSSGVLARVPAAIDHAVLGAERQGAGWAVIMRDVSAALLPDHVRLTRGDSRRVLAAAAALHAEFWDDQPLELCSLVDRYQILSPATARREAGGVDVVPSLIGRGWERFGELVPAEVAKPVLAGASRGRDGRGRMAPSRDRPPGPPTASTTRPAPAPPAASPRRRGRSGRCGRHRRR